MEAQCHSCNQRTVNDNESRLVLIMAMVDSQPRLLWNHDRIMCQVPSSMLTARILTKVHGGTWGTIVGRCASSSLVRESIEANDGKGKSGDGFDSDGCNFNSLSSQWCSSGLSP
ncbi:hypothetical protein RIF29_26148 [Crotalaria pallida]|uniref:Uncharacterized protein n=1 Tax=Crotalaria pallida TaxID=3830 RepID=A0AAN9ESD8_CROPI